MGDLSELDALGRSMCRSAKVAGSTVMIAATGREYQVVTHPSLGLGNKLDLFFLVYE